MMKNLSAKHHRLDRLNREAPKVIAAMPPEGGVASDFLSGTAVSAFDRRACVADEVAGDAPFAEARRSKRRATS
jgi:hypothetical protein